MPSSIFEKKSVYHSALVKAGQIDITITCDAPQESKFSKPNAPKPPYISFKHEGSEHFLEVENDECGEALSGYKGQTITVEATGSRDDARITVLGSGEPQQQRQTRTACAGAGSRRRPRDRSRRAALERGSRRR